jgi:hypothetical protein
LNSAFFKAAAGTHANPYEHVPLKKIYCKRRSLLKGGVTALEGPTLDFKLQLM